MKNKVYTIVAVCVMAAAVMLPAAPTQAQDTRVGETTEITDTQPRFYASGTLISTDADNNGLDARAYEVIDATPPPDADYWSFHITHKGNWDNHGAENVQICIAHPSIHYDGPHPPPAGVEDTDPNILAAPHCTAPLTVTWGTNNTKRAWSMAEKHPHPTNATDHWDHYVIGGVFTAVHCESTGGHSISGAWELHAVHSWSANWPGAFRKCAMGSSSESGSEVSYDSSSGLLSFSVGSIDILDGEGGLSGAVDAIYANDPVMQGHISVSNLEFMGAVDGEFRFGGGHLTIEDPDANFQFKGELSKYVIRGADDSVSPVTNVGIFDSIAISDVEHDHADPSLFLVDFATVNLCGYGVANGELMRQSGIGLSFSSVSDLVTATEEFTQSATVPATVVISAGFEIPDADLNDNGVVNGADLALLLGSWGPCWDCDADLNSDTEVNAADLAELLGAWGPITGM